MRNILFGLIAALILCVTVAVPTIGHVSTWKWVLGGLGLVLFIRAGLEHT